MNRGNITNLLKTGCILVVLNLLSAPNIFAKAGSFYKGEDKYLGFYWFEHTKNTLNKDVQKFRYPTPEEALDAIEARKKALDNARSQMVELSYIENIPPEILRQAIIKYKKLEAQMYDSTIKLVHASEMANFTNPEIANLTEFPTNVFANKIKRNLEEEKRISKVQEFASKFDLLLFAEDTCSYCKAFIPVITNFAISHSFTLDITTLSSAEGKIAQNLGINTVPTLVAISKNGKQLFEISRGFNSLPELEEKIILASDYSAEQTYKSTR